MPQPIEMVPNCDGCSLKIPVDCFGGIEEGYYCNYGTFNADAETAPDDCKLHDGDVIVRLKVRR